MASQFDVTLNKKQKKTKEKLNTGKKRSERKKTKDRVDAAVKR